MHATRRAALSVQGGRNLIARGIFVVYLVIVLGGLVWFVITGLLGQ
jgi:hypothetical protein